MVTYQNYSLAQFYMHFKPLACGSQGGSVCAGMFNFGVSSF